MGKRKFESAFSVDDISIELNRSAVVRTAFQCVSNYLNSLQLPAEANNELVDLMVIATTQAEQCAYIEGFKKGQQRSFREPRVLH